MHDARPFGTATPQCAHKALEDVAVLFLSLSAKISQQRRSHTYLGYKTIVRLLLV